MARQMTATWSDARATFLLEVALDRARLKERLAQSLLDERARRGAGDPRRFPQPKMAELLDYSLRQYQRLENPEDPSLPDWADLEQIAEKLGLDASALFGKGDQPESISANHDAPGDLGRVLARVEEVHEDVRRLQKLVESLLSSLAQAN